MLSLFDVEVESHNSCFVVLYLFTFPWLVVKTPEMIQSLLQSCVLCVKIYSMCLHAPSFFKPLSGLFPQTHDSHEANT